MTSSVLLNKRVAILAADGFEQAELEEPWHALKAAGAQVFIVSPHGGKIQGMKHMEKGTDVPVDMSLDLADAGDFDGLVVPGGLINPDTLRSNPEAVEFVRGFAEASKPIAAICHGPWVLIEAGVVKGRRMTSWPAIQTDIRNAGGEWVDEEVVVDRGVITSRKPADLTAFNQKLIEEVAKSNDVAITTEAPPEG